MQQTSLNAIPTRTLYEQPVVYTKIHLQINDSLIGLVGFMMFNATFNNISAIVAVSFIGGGNRRKPPTCLKSLTNFIT